MLSALILAVIAVGVGLLRGGSLDSLANTKFRCTPLLIAGLGAQLVLQIWSPPWLGDAGELAVLLGSNFLVALFLLGNRRLPGVLLAVVGLALNVAVIGANGAMPVFEGAAEEVSLAGAGPKHELLDEDTVFPWLGDVIPVPGVNEILSVGDVLLALGIAQLVYSRTTWHVRARHRAEPQP
jgi:hypothetical protein